MQCGYSLYSEDYVAIDIEGGFVNPIPPFFPVIGEPYCGNDCIEKVYGCTDTTALNYDYLANTNDSTCYYWDYSSKRYGFISSSAIIFF